MLVSNNRSQARPRVARTLSTSVLAKPQRQASDQVTLSGQPDKTAPAHDVKSGKWKSALIGGAAGALVGAVGGAIGGPVGGVAAAPVVALIGGVAGATAFKFIKEGEQDEKASAEARKFVLRTAVAGLAGAAVVGLGVAGGWVGATAAGVGGLATGAAIGYGLGK